MEFGHLFLAALSGGGAVKILDICYAEFRAWLTRSDTKEHFADQHLEPLLKSADELVGKLRSLSESDFKPIAHARPNTSASENHEFASLLYLFGRFWARIEQVREEGMSKIMASDHRGKHLLTFFDCIESRRIRIIPRILQRSIGELFTSGEHIISFIGFSERYMSSEEPNQWIEPLGRFLSRANHTSERQRLLQYGVVVHAMIDTLDPDHHITRDRPSWPNKLTRRSWRDLKFRVFGTYLTMVPNPQKYIGPPKKSGPNRGGSPKRL